MKILLSFLPWILFAALFGKTKHEIIISILIATAVFLKTEWRHLTKRFILSSGTLLFFVFIFVFTVILKNIWVINHALFLSNVVLATIAWFSLVIGRPFTSQYARELTPQQVWRKPGFIKVNQVLTILWGSIFLFSAVLHLIPFGQSIPDKIIHQILMYGSITLGILANSAYPTWYRKREQQIQNKNN